MYDALGSIFSDPCTVIRTRDRAQSVLAQIIAGKLLQCVLPANGSTIIVIVHNMIVTIMPRGRNIVIWYIMANSCRIGLIFRRIDILFVINLQR